MEESKNLCKAMAEAFREIEGAVKDKANPFFRSKYADLGNVVDAIKPALTNHGLWFLQKVHPTPASPLLKLSLCMSLGKLCLVE